MLLYVLYDLLKFFETLGCLRVEVDVVCEVEFLDVVDIFYDDGLSLCLSNKSEHFSVSCFSKDDNLGVGIVEVLLSDAFLEL